MATFNPKFLTKCAITDVSQISDSVGSSALNRYRIMNRNDEIQYATIGGTSGTRTITWTPGGAVSINRIFLQNINLDTFTIKYNTSSDFSTPISLSGNTKTNLYFEFNAVSVTNVVISLTTTMTVGDTGKIGQLYIGTELFEMSSPAGSMRVVPRVQQTIIDLSDGTAYKNYVRSLRDYEIALIGVNSTERENYIDLFNRNRRESVVFIPYPATSSDTWAGLAGHYHVRSAADFDNYTEDIEANGYNVNLYLSQCGGVG